ncbi:MAG: hypothetical protein ACE5G1_08235 [bacterium]
MGSTLGSNNIVPHAPKYGNEYLVDLRTVGLSFVALGLYVKPWEFETGHLNPEFPSVGYYESQIFDPGRWVPTYPNPAFEYTTLRDAYWGAKIVVSFRNEDIRAIVETARMSDRAAKEYLIKTLIERRDKIGRYWFARMNPLDKFRFEHQESGVLTLAFDDLAVEGGLTRAEESKYIYTFRHHEKRLHKRTQVKEPVIPISKNGEGFLDEFVKSSNRKNKPEENMFSVRIQTQRGEHALSKVYFYYPGPSGIPKVVGIVREE